MFGAKIIRKLERIQSNLEKILFFSSETVSRIIKALTVINSILAMFVAYALLNFEGYEILILVALQIVFLYIHFYILWCTYLDMCAITKRKYSKLSPEQNELIEDAVELIKKAMPSIEMTEFDTFGIYFGNSFTVKRRTGKFNGKTDIYITFKQLQFFSKDICFHAVLHEVLHAQNFKSNIQIFTEEFLEGLNELLTLWLIKTYSTKYEIKPYEKRKVNFGIKKLDYYINGIAYPTETILVGNIIKKAGLDLQEVFENYVEFNSEYFKAFVPEKYLIK